MWMCSAERSTKLPVSPTFFLSFWNALYVIVTTVPDLPTRQRGGTARMSGTSLARQLAALRTPGTSLPTSATYAGPFLFPEAGELTSLAALKENVAESLNLLYSEDSGLSR